MKRKGRRGRRGRGGRGEERGGEEEFIGFIKALTAGQGDVRGRGTELLNLLVARYLGDFRRIHTQTYILIDSTL